MCGDGSGSEEAGGCHCAEQNKQDAGGGIHRLVVAAEGVEHSSCSGGGRDTEAHLGPHTAHCAAPRVRQLSVGFLALRGTRNEAADKAAEQGNAKPQSHPAWVTDIVTGVERQVRNEMYRAFEEGRMTRTHRSALLDHVRPAPKHTKVDRLGESLLAQFRTSTSKHFGWLHRVLTRKMDQLECRWCSAQDAASDAAEEHPRQ
ncbi:hypothetical protein ERJ75_001104300 [Trypanosoma vivax]|nr:hypothetical protein ERJ75_001104300 [Trypanosoma vivax]